MSVTKIQVVQDLLRMYFEQCKMANTAIDQRLLTEAIQHLEQAKEMLIQLREIGFQVGSEEMVKNANTTLLVADSNIRCIHRVSGLLSLGLFDVDDALEALKMPKSEVLH
jgi:hypothetical protein